MSEIHPVNTHEPEAREKFLRAHGVTMTWELLGGDPAQGEPVRYRFVLKRRGREGESALVWAEFPFSCGSGHYTNFTYTRKPPFKVIKPLVPEVERFLECLRMDFTAIRHGETFEGFVDEMGMNDDAKQAVKVWEAIKTQWAAIQTILGQEAARAFVDLEIEDQWR